MTTKTKVQRAVEHIFTHPGTRSTDLAPIFGCLPKDVPAYMKDVMKLGLLVTCKVELPNKVVAYEYRPSASAPSKAPDLRAWRASMANAEPKPTATNAADTPSIAVRAVTTQAGSGDITPASVHSATIVDGGSKRAVPPPKGTEHVIEAAKRDEQPAAPASDLEKHTASKLSELADYHLMLSNTGGKNDHMDSVAILLIRPGDLFTDESGNHPSERFLELHIPRAKLNEMAEQCNRDFEQTAIVALRSYSKNWRAA